jgi:uncharacterized protein YbaR (Trm112 family)
MNKSFIELLCCIKCRGRLFLSEDYNYQINLNDIEFGVLGCKNCNALYPILKSVGVFFKENLLCHYLNQDEKDTLKQMGFNLNKNSSLNNDQERQLRSARNWIYQWKEVYNYSKEDLEKESFFSEELFFRFIPIKASDLKNKNIVIWCDGKGRGAYRVLKHSPNLIIVNEIGDEIYGIHSLISDIDNLLLLRCDMTDNPLRPSLADYSICDHALQHIIDNKLAFVRMLEVLRPGGIVALNVYSYENNCLMTRIIEPLKFLLHKLPLKIQHYFAFAPAIFIYLLIRLVYIPMQKLCSYKICNKFPLFDHMISWSKDSFRFIWTACFDLIHAPIAYYFRKSDIINMAALNNIKVMKLINTHGTTWSFVGEKIGRDS